MGDARIFGFCKEDFEHLHPDRNLSVNGPALRRLAVLCNRAKCNLSMDTQTQITIHSVRSGRRRHGGIGIEYERTISRQKLEELNADSAQTLFSLLETCLSNCGLAKCDVQGLVVVGGSSNIPQLRDTVQSCFPGCPLADVHEDIPELEWANIFGVSAEAVAIVRGQSYPRKAQ